MSEEMEIAILFNSAAFSAVGGLLLGLWHDIKGKKMPEFETTSDPEKEPKRVQTKANTHERTAFVFACMILSGALGAMIGLYYLGFMAQESIPNAYGRAFISLGAGFLMPKIFEYTDSLAISNLARRFFDKNT